MQCLLACCLVALSNIQPISVTTGFWFQLPAQARRLQGEADCTEGADAVVTEANFTNGPRGMYRVPWVVEGNRFGDGVAFQ